MYCRNCGKQIDYNSKYCSYCGTKLTSIIDNDIKESSNISSFSQQKENNNIKEIYRYDYLYERDLRPLITGILMFFVNLIIIFSGWILIEVNIILSLLSLVLRILITIWCVNIAQKLNRNETGWGFLAFFLPVLALILIGIKKKFLYSKDYPTMASEDKSIENNNIAFRLAKENKYLDALFFADKSIEFNPHNHAAFDTRGYIKYFLKDFKSALEDFNKSIELEDNHAVKYFHRGNVFKEIGKIEDALEDWQIAAEMGLDDAKTAIMNNSNISI